MDILSQDEVDALLSAVSSGAVDVDEVDEVIETRQIAQYDFKRPGRVSKEQFRTLKALNDNFARYFSNALSTYLRALVDVHRVSMEQLTYGEFIMSVPDPTCISRFSLDPLPHEAVLEINPQLVFAIVDRLFGGKGESNVSDRELTGIESSVMTKVIIKALNNIKQAWSHAIELEPNFHAIESNPQFVQIVWPGETVILSVFEIKLQRSSGLMSICFPYATLEPLLTQMGSQFIFSQTDLHISDEEYAGLESRIRRTRIPLSVQLGHSKITVDDFLDLKTGDILMLDTKIHEPVLLYANNYPSFWMAPGKVGKKTAVQVIRKVEKGEVIG